MKQKLPHRPCAGIMLLNSDNQVFVAKRIDTLVEAWQMPQGGIDEGEDPKEAAIRELEEETGITNASIIAEFCVPYVNEGMILLKLAFNVDNLN